jgi:hypothetical protein
MRLTKVTLSLIFTYLIALLLRLLPGFNYNLPYGYSSWTHLGAVKLLLETGSLDQVSPVGAPFYLLTVSVCFVFGMPPLFVFVYVMPFITSTIVFPVYFVTKRLTDNRVSGLYAALFAAGSGFFVHEAAIWTPQALAILLAAFCILLCVDAIEKFSMKKFFLLFLIFIATCFTHPITAMFLLLGFILLCPMILYFKEKWGELGLITPLLFTLISVFSFTTILVYFTDGFRVDFLSFMFDLKFGAADYLFGSIFAFAFSMLLYISAYCWRKIATNSFRTALKISLKFTILIFTVLSLIIISSKFGQLKIDYVYAVPYILPYIAILIFPAFIGLSFLFADRSREWKRLFSQVWFVAPFVGCSLLVFSSQWLMFGYYAVPFILLGIFPLVGVGYTVFSKLFNSKMKVFQACVFAYLLCFLAFSAYPQATSTLGNNDAYYPSEYDIINWLATYAKAGTIVDADTRMASMLSLTSKVEVTERGESWLWSISQSNLKTSVNPKIELIIITDSMVKYSVTDWLTDIGKPLPEGVVRTLDNLTCLNLIYSSDHISIYRNIK